MSDSKIRDTAEAVKGIVEAVPVYQDALQPAAREIGTALQTVAKTINVLLAPVSALVWGYDQIKEFVNSQVAEKLKNVPPEQIVSPKPNVAGPALESLRYTGHDESLRDLYANLLAASMDAKTASGVHPSFVEIIRQLTPDEAKIVKLFVDNRPFPLLTVRSEYKAPSETKKGGLFVMLHFSRIGDEAGCEFSDFTPTYLGNLCRLGLAEIPEGMAYSNPEVYAALENHPRVLRAKKAIEDDPELKADLLREYLRITDFGRQFCMSCVVPHDQIPRADLMKYDMSGKVARE